VSTNEQIMLKAAELVGRLERLTGGSLGIYDVVWDAARQRAAELENGSLSTRAAEAVMGCLYPDTDPPAEFWGTDLGRAVSSAIGYHRALCPFPSAAAILGVTRQRVYQLCTEGQLVRVDDIHGDVGVSPASLRAHLAHTDRRATKTRVEVP
jgi:hypothetical protein